MGGSIEKGAEKAVGEECQRDVETTVIDGAEEMEKTWSAMRSEM